MLGQLVQALAIPPLSLQHTLLLFPALLQLHPYGHTRLVTQRSMHLRRKLLNHPLDVLQEPLELLYELLVACHALPTFQLSMP